MQIWVKFCLQCQKPTFCPCTYRQNIGHFNVNTECLDNSVIKRVASSWLLPFDMNWVGVFEPLHSSDFSLAIQESVIFASRSQVQIHLYDCVEFIGLPWPLWIIILHAELTSDKAIKGILEITKLIRSFIISMLWLPRKRKWQEELEKRSRTSGLKDCRISFVLLTDQ